MFRLPAFFLTGSLIFTSRVVSANDLLDIYVQAKQQDQEYQAASHQRDAAVEARPTALAAILPQLNATDVLAAQRLHVLSSQQSGSSSINNGGNGNNGSPANAFSPIVDYYKTNAYSVNLSQTLFDWSAFQTVAQASGQVAQAEATLRSAQQVLITRCAQAYFNVLNAREVLRIDLRARETYKDQLEQAREKFKAGVADVTDVHSSQAALESSNAAVIADRIALHAAVRALGVIVGGPVINVADLRNDIPLVHPDPTSADEWVAAASDNNPDLLSARYAAEVARKEIGISRSKYLPTLNAIGSVGRSTSDSVFGTDAITDSVGVNLNWNLYSGGLVASEVRRAHASSEQAQSQLELQRRTIDRDTRNDFQQVVDGIDSVRTNRQAVISNRASLASTMVGLKVGTRSETDVIVANESLSAAEKAYAQARYNYLMSVLTLKQDAGYLADLDLMDIDRLLLPTPTSALEAGPADPVDAIPNEAGGLAEEMTASARKSPPDQAGRREALQDPPEIPSVENASGLKHALSIATDAESHLVSKPAVLPDTKCRSFHAVAHSAQWNACN